MPATNDSAFPHAVPAAAGADLLRNPVYALTVLSETDGATTTYTVTSAPDAESDPESSVRTTDLSEAQSAYASAWISQVARDIGLGFHPDTPSDSYSPPLEPALAAQYDEMIGYCHDHLDNPYEDAFEGWRQAGLVADEPKP